MNRNVSSKILKMSLNFSTLGPLLAKTLADNQHQLKESCLSFALAYLHGPLEEIKAMFFASLLGYFNFKYLLYNPTTAAQR